MIKAINNIGNSKKYSKPLSTSFKGYYAVPQRLSHDVYRKSSVNMSENDVKSAISNPFLMSNTAKAIYGDSTNDKNAIALANQLKDPQKALAFFKEAKSQIDSDPTIKQDPYLSYFSKQLDLTIKELSSQKHGVQDVSFSGNKKAVNIFSKLKVGTKGEFNDYFPVDKFGMDEYTFNSRLYTILRDEKKKFLLVETLNSELSKMGMSDELNIYIKENKSEQMGKMVAGTLGASGTGQLMVAARALYAMNNKKMDSFDKSVEAIRLSHDFTDLLVTGGALSAVWSFNAQVAAGNAMNPEMFSKTAIWIGNGLIALSCLAVRQIIKESRMRDEREAIEALKYVKAIHICMQEGYLDSNKVGKLIQNLYNAQ